MKVEIQKRRRRAEDKKVNKPEEVYNLSEVQEIKDAIQEHLFFIGLDRQNNILNISLLGIGNGTQINIDTKYIVRTALITESDKVILVHNHPSNTLEPSKNDKHITNYTRKVLEAFNIELIDHIIVAEKGYISMGKNESINKDYKDEKTEVIEHTFLIEENKRLKEELKKINSKLIESEEEFDL